MKLTDLTGHELNDLHEVLGEPYTDAVRAGDPMAMYGLVWIIDRRTNPAATWDQVLDKPLGEVQTRWEEAMRPADPTNAGSGETSPRSATSGA